MGVVNVKEQRTGDNAGGSVETKTATRVFTVLMDSADDSSVRAELAAGIPREGNPHPHDNWRLAKQPQTRREGNSLLFTVTVPYETPPIPEGSDGSGNPVSQPVEIEWGFDLSEEAIDEDVNGLPIQNSSEEPFDPPLTDTKATMILNVVKNEPTFNPLVAASFINSTNEKEWFTFPPGVCWMNGIRAPRIVNGDLVYYRVSFTVAIRMEGVVVDGGRIIGSFSPLGWKKRLLDQGFRTLGAVFFPHQEYDPILDTKGKKLTEPALLNGLGQRLPKGDGPEWLEFETKKSRDWDKLKIF